MKKAQLAVLLGFLHSQEEIFSKILRDIEATEPDSSERKSHLGYLLHNLYCALEDLLQEVAKTFENRLEDPGPLSPGTFTEDASGHSRHPPSFAAYPGLSALE